MQVPRWHRNPWCCAALHSSTNTFEANLVFLLVRLNLGFILRETAATLLHTFLLGSPNERVIHVIMQLFLTQLPGSKRISARGVSRFQSLYFVIVFLSLFLSSLVCFIYQKHKKISYFYFRVIIFCLVLNLLK